MSFFDTFRDLLVEDREMRENTRGPSQDRSAVDGGTAGAFLGEFGAALAPGAGLADASGKYYSPTQGEQMPGLLETARGGNYGMAALQGLGLLGDALYFGGPAGIAAGGVAKLPKAVSRGMDAARAVGGAADASRGAQVTSSAGPRQPTFALLSQRQAEALSAAERAKMDKAVEQFPALREVFAYATPQEAKLLLGSQANMKKAARVFEELPPAAEIAATAKAGSAKRGWYHASADALSHVFGPQDSVRFAELLAALSPQTSVENNLLNTLNTWKNWVRAGRPVDEASITRIMGDSVMGDKGVDSVLDAWKGNAIRVLQADNPGNTTLSGPKVDSFYRNLIDDTMRVTNDAWMANALGVRQEMFSGSPSAAQLAAGNPGLSPGYIATSAKIRRGGDLIGMSPSETQETAWSYAMPMMERQVGGVRASDMLPRLADDGDRILGGLPDDVIRGTPDFSTLLQQPTYARILDDAGYAPQRQTMVPHDWSLTERPPLTAADLPHLQNSARRLENLQRQRTVDQVYDSPGAYGTTAGRGGAVPEVPVIATPEYIPGGKSQHLPGLIDATPGAQANFSSAMSGMFTSPRGTDRLHEAAFRRGPADLAGTNVADLASVRPTQGFWQPEDGGPMQFNPARALPTMSSVDDIPTTMRGLEATETLRGVITGQDAVAAHAAVPQGNARMSAGTFGAPAARVQLSQKMSQDQARRLQETIGTEGLMATDTGAGVNLLYGGAKPAELDGLLGRARGVLEGTEEMKGAAKVTGTPYTLRGRVGDTMYRELPWGQGDGAVTRDLLGTLRRRHPEGGTYMDRLDTPEIRTIAADAAAKYAGAAKQQGGTNPALMNFLGVVAEEGLRGLPAALRSKEILLPGLVALGISPVAIEELQREMGGPPQGLLEGS